MHDTDVVSVERVIAAPPDPIFDLLAHPARHRDIDGSGTVQGAREAEAPRLELGARFGMSMRLGLPYSMVSEVIEFEEGRRIAWQTFPPGPLRHLFGGRIWRYELEPVDGGTRVRESWDISQEKVKVLVSAGAVKRKTAEAMTKTLERIEGFVTA